MEQHNTYNAPQHAEQYEDDQELLLGRRDVLTGAVVGGLGAAGAWWLAEEADVLDGGPDDGFPDGIYNETETPDYDFEGPETTQELETPTPTTEAETTPSTPEPTTETTTEQYDTPTPTTETTTETTTTTTTTETTTTEYETPTPRETTMPVEEGCSIGEERVRTHDLPGGGVFGGGLQDDAEWVERRLDHAIKEYNHDMKWPRFYMPDGPRYENDIIGEYSKSIDFYRDQGTFSQDRFDVVVYARTFEDGPYGDMYRKNPGETFTNEIGQGVGAMLESAFNPDDRESLWPYTQNLDRVDEPAIEDAAIVLDGGANGYFEACLGPDQLAQFPSSEAKFRDLGRSLISDDTIHDGEYSRTNIVSEAVNDAGDGVTNSINKRVQNALTDLIHR